MVFGVPYGGALGTNPITTVNGSKVVTIAHTAHGLTTGMMISINGVSGAVNSIPAAEFLTERALTVVDANSYTITMLTTATASSSGGGTTCRYQHGGADVAIINCTTGISVPPLQVSRWDIHATINVGGAGGGGQYGIKFDSLMSCDIKFTGQLVVSSGYDGCVQFKPQSELPQDYNGPVIGDNVIEFSSVVCLKSTGLCYDFDATVAPISSNRFLLIEPNSAGGGGTGVRVQVGTTSTFDHNHLDITDIHGASTGINEGVSATNAANIYGNTWNCQIDPLAVGVEMFGKQSKWTLSVTNLEGSPTNGVTLNTSAKQNLIEFIRNDATTKVNDSATERSNRIISPVSYVYAHKNGTNQTGVVTATPTDVTFNTEQTDALGEFDGTTFTAQWPGLYHVCARVGWTAATDATLLTTTIHANGSAFSDNVIYASGTGGSQGSLINSIVRLAGGGTIKIQAQQQSGANKDISGSTTVTYLMIAKVG